MKTSLEYSSVFNVRQFGAMADGQTLDSGSIQSAQNEAVGQFICQRASM
jgi:polygalacturonase